MNMRSHTRQLPPTRRLYIKVCELNEKMDRLAADEDNTEAMTKLGRIERRFWPLQGELLRRLDAYDELAKRAERVTQ